MSLRGRLVVVIRRESEGKNALGSDGDGDKERQSKELGALDSKDEGETMNATH